MVDVCSAAPLTNPEIWIALGVSRMSCNNASCLNTDTFACVSNRMSVSRRPCIPSCAMNTLCDPSNPNVVAVNRFGSLDTASFAASSLGQVLMKWPGLPQRSQTPGVGFEPLAFPIVFLLFLRAFLSLCMSPTVETHNWIGKPVVTHGRVLLHPLLSQIVRLKNRVGILGEGTQDNQVVEIGDELAVAGPTVNFKRQSIAVQMGIQRYFD